MIKIPENIKGIIFDCDGTLADTMPLHLSAWQEAFKRIDRNLPFDFFDSQKGSPTEKIILLYNRLYNDNIDPASFSKLKEELTIIKLKDAKPISDITEVAEKFKNILPMAVASGAKRKSVETTLAAIGIKDFFSTILTADDPIEPKPSPDIFIEAARRINISPSECLVFEDGDLGLEAATKAGMFSIDVRKIIIG